MRVFIHLPHHCRAGWSGRHFPFFGRLRSKSCPHRFSDLPPRPASTDSELMTWSSFIPTQYQENVLVMNSTFFTPSSHHRLNFHVEFHFTVLVFLDSLLFQFQRLNFDFWVKYICHKLKLLWIVKIFQTEFGSARVRPLGLYQACSVSQFQVWSWSVIGWLSL